MTKEEFIRKLKRKLDVLEKSEIDDIVEEYEGYIEEKKSAGMSEKDAVKALGNIDEIAKDLLSAYKIKEDYHENNSINIINKFTDAVIDGIESFINVFKEKSAKEIARIIVEIFLLYIVILICKFPFEFLMEIGYDTFMTFGYKIGILLYKIWELILDLIYFGLAIIFFFKILKEKIIEKNTSAKINKENTNKTEIKEEKKYNTKDVKTEKKKKAVKESNNSFDIIGVFANILLYFVKFIVGIFAVCNAMYIAGMAFCLAISMYLIIKGITYYGIIFLSIALLLLGIAFFELFIKFIFDRKQNYTKFIIVILISLILGGTGMGLFATEIASTTVLDNFKDNSFKTINETIKMDDKLLIPEYYDIEIDNSLKNSIKIEYKYNKDYLDLKISSRKYIKNTNYNYIMYHPDFNAIWTNKTFNKLIDDAKKKVFYDYGNLVNIKIFMSEESYNKLQKNIEEYDKLLNSEVECYEDEEGIEICE